MKILHVLNSADPENGGTVEAVRGMAESQAKLGHEVTVISTGDPEKTPASNHPIHWNICPVKWRPWRWSSDLSATMAGLIGKNDIVHLHTMWDFPVSEGARLSRNHQKPYLISPHGMLDQWSLSQHALKKKVYLALIAGRVLNYAKAVHFTSAGEYRNSTLPGKNQKGFICHLGVDEVAATQKSTDSFYERYPGLKGKRFILFLGRLHAKKNPELVVECFNKVYKNIENLALVMAGPAEQSYLEKLKKKVGKLKLNGRVVFTGLLDRSLVSAGLRSADAFVLPSLQENFGLSVAEAMAAGCPVIVSPAVNLSDDIQESHAGIVCQPTEESLSKAISQVLSDSNLRKTMGENGRQLVMGKFQWERSAEMMLQVYEDVLSGRHSCPAWVTK